MSNEFEAAAVLRQLALNESLKAYVLEQPALYQTLLNAALRFIGGESLQQCTAVAKQLNQAGHAVTIDFMGESTRDIETATQATQEFLQVVDAITKHNLNATVSLDLSHIGMVIDPELGYDNACTLAAAAQQAGTEMMISMEGPDRTDGILSLYNRLCERFSNVGITLQAYLHRTPSDLHSALQRPGKIRLVKGAYAAPSAVALPRGTELDAAYRQLMSTLLSEAHPCSIATHDLSLLNDAQQYLSEQKTASSAEFEMLKGVASDRLSRMQALGYATRVYLPYGKEWHLYLCNRLAEHPPNLYQAIVDAAASSR